MKKTKYLVILIIYSIYSSKCKKSNCIKKSGEITSYTYNYSNQVSEIEFNISANIQISSEIKQNTELEIITTENIKNIIKIDATNDKILINITNCVEDNPIIKINIKVPNLKIITTKSDCKINSERVLQKDSLIINTFENSMCDFTIQTKYFEYNNSSNLSSTIDGYAKFAKINSTSLGSINAFDMPVDTIFVTSKIGAQINVLSVSYLDVRLDGNSVVYYKGNPTIINSDLKGKSQLIYLD